ncbi:GNAT family N-acetyltransferase [Paenibacillus barcinonensis]|uniref:GNAT family N-acetyltransferase n=1 Tax=Paenibacillus barcinonensis TaxID=198119 RepID=UPI003F591EAE
MGYELAPEHWRKGIMAEVIKRVVQYGFEGTLRDCFYEKGKFVDAVVFAILSEDHR